MVVIKWQGGGRLLPGATVFLYDCRINPETTAREITSDGQDGVYIVRKSIYPFLHCTKTTINAIPLGLE